MSYSCRNFYFTDSLVQWHDAACHRARWLTHCWQGRWLAFSLWLNSWRGRWRKKMKKTQSYLSIPFLPQRNPRSKSKILATRIHGWNLHPFGLENQGSHRQLRMLPVPGLLGEALPAPSFGAEEMEYVCRCLRRNTSVPWRWRKGQLEYPAW